MIDEKKEAEYLSEITVFATTLVDDPPGAVQGFSSLGVKERRHSDGAMTTIKSRGAV